MVVKSVIFNNDILGRLLRLKEKNRLAHTYLFVGSMYGGKATTAIHFAKSLFCENATPTIENSFCDECQSCIKINNRSHPDLYVIECEYGEKIKIEQIRALIEQVKLRPFLAPYKVFIVRNVENVTLEGSNALLKTLEEPAAGNILILTTSMPEKVLATIRSRCHTFYFSNESNQKLVQQLKTDYDVNGDDAHCLSYFAEGCLGKAKHLNGENFIAFKNEMLDDFVFSPDSDQFIKGIVANKVETKLLLDILLSWVRDCILIKSKVDDAKIVHRDRMSELKRFALNYSFDELSELNREIVKSSKLLAENLNIKIPLLIIKEKLWGN